MITRRLPISTLFPYTTLFRSKIIADVRRNRDAALFAYAKKFDHTDLRRTGVWITQKEIRVAQKATSAGFRKAIEKAAENVRTVAEKQLPRPWTVETSPGVKIHQVVRPIEAIGCYIPGGQFSLVSTLLMTVVPANVAGVPSVVAVCPAPNRSEEHTSELQSHSDLVCRLLLEKKKKRLHKNVRDVQS